MAMIRSTTLTAAGLLLLFSFSNAFVGQKGSPLHRRLPALCESKTAVADDKLTAKQQDFCIGYCNKHHGSTLLKFADAFSELGTEKAKANTWSGDSYTIQEVTLVNLDREKLVLDVIVEKRGKGTNKEHIEVSLNADPVEERSRVYPTLPQVPDDEERAPIDDVVRRLNRLCWIVGDKPMTGKLTQLAIQLGGSDLSKIPENLYLNQVPHNVYVRDYFYAQASKAILEAVVLCSQGKIPNRMKMISQFPETNPSMDSYRIGTILEMARTICIRLAEQNVRVRLCVQGSMGVGIFTGVPKQLNGVSKLIQMMDWQSEKGESNEGMVGNFVNFGAIGPEHVQNEVKNEDGEIIQQQDDVFLIIAPQSMVGMESSIMPALEGMVQAAGDRPVILMNPDLVDKPSAAGQQSVRGRQARIDFANSFQTVYQFKNIYVSGTSYFPILGATTKLGPKEPFIAYQRRDFANDSGEIYVPFLSCETMPTGEDILAAFDR